MNFTKRKVEKRKEELREIARREGNKFCFDCNQRGPLYVVFPFTIFVCSTCAAVHRSFQHKVKGISMCEFTDDELNGLRVGGNDRAFVIWIGNDENAIKSNKFNINYESPLFENLVYDFIGNVFQAKKFFNVEEWHKFKQEASNPPITPTQQGSIHKNTNFSKPSSFNVISFDNIKSKEAGNSKNTSSSTVHVADNATLHSSTEASKIAVTVHHKDEIKESNSKVADDLFVKQNPPQTKTLEDILSPSPDTQKTVHLDRALASKQSEDASQIQSLTAVQENYTNCNKNDMNKSTTQSVLDDLFASTSPELPITTGTRTTTAAVAALLPPNSSQTITDFYNSNCAVNVNGNNNSDIKEIYNANKLQGTLQTNELFAGTNANMWNFSTDANNNLNNNNNNFSNSNNDSNRTQDTNSVTNAWPQTNFTSTSHLPQPANTLRHINFLQEPPPLPPPPSSSHHQQYFETATSYDPMQQVTTTPMTFQDGNFCNNNNIGADVNNTNHLNNNNMSDWTNTLHQQQTQQQQQTKEQQQQCYSNAFASLNPFMTL